MVAGWFHTYHVLMWTEPSPYFRGIPLETDSEGDGGASHAEGEIPGAKGNCRRGLAEWHHLRSEAPRGEGRWDHNSERNRELYWFDVKKIFFRR